MKPREVATKIIKKKPYSMDELVEALNNHVKSHDVKNPDHQAIAGAILTALMKELVGYDFKLLTHYINWEKLLKKKIA